MYNKATVLLYTLSITMCTLNSCIMGYVAPEALPSVPLMALYNTIIGFIIALYNRLPHGT